MSKKRKLESLQQLGQKPEVLQRIGLLKPSDVKQLQSGYRVEPRWLTLHNVSWATLSVVLGLGWSGIVAALGVAWKLSH